MEWKMVCSCFFCEIVLMATSVDILVALLQILKLEIEKVAAQRSFLFLWCGSHEGLNEGRKVKNKNM